MAEKWIDKYHGSGELIFEDNKAASVNYEIDEYQEFVSGELDGQLPILRSRRGRVSHAEGHPDWHPLTLLQPGPFTLVMDGGRKLKVSLLTVHGDVQAIGDFF